MTGINPGMPNAKMAGNSQINHMESVSLMYDKITWRYVDGNVQYTDDWNVRAQLNTRGYFVPLYYPLKALNHIISK